VKVKIGSHTAEVPLEFAHLVETDSTGLTPHTDDLSAKKVAESYRRETSVESETDDPVGTLVLKATTEQQTKSTTTGTTDFDFLKALNEADVRDKEPSNVTLHKNGLPDWSWSTPISDTTLGKRANGTARERFRRELEKFFAGHSEEYEEAASIAAEALSEELSTIESEAA